MVFGEPFPSIVLHNKHDVLLLIRLLWDADLNINFSNRYNLIHKAYRLHLGFLINLTNQSYIHFLLDRGLIGDLD